MRKIIFSTLVKSNRLAHVPERGLSYVDFFRVGLFRAATRKVPWQTLANHKRIIQDEEPGGNLDQVYRSRRVNFLISAHLSI